MKKIRNILQITTYYLLPGFLAGVVYFLYTQNTNALKGFSIEIGEWSLNLLIAILFFKPLVVFTQNKIPQMSFLRKFLPWRRELGIATFYLAFFHMLGIFLTTNMWNNFDQWLYGFSDPVFFGTVSLVMMFLLYLTSNRFSIKKMKRNWNKLHYLAYPALFFALMHKFGLEKNSLVPAFIIFGFFCMLKFFEWKKSDKIKMLK